MSKQCKTGKYVKNAYYPTSFPLTATFALKVASTNVDAQVNNPQAIMSPPGVVSHLIVCTILIRVNLIVFGFGIFRFDIVYIIYRFCL